MTFTDILASYPPDVVATVRRISWPAIFSGIFVALGLELVFIAFGLFIGFTLTQPGGIIAWSEAWYFVTCFVSLLVGGWVAARLASNTIGSGALHGIVTWGVTTMTTFALISIMTFGLAGNAISAAQAALTAANRAGVAVPQTEIAPAPSAPAINHAATAVIADASTVFLVIFGGLLCGLVGSLIGGAVGDIPRRRLVPPPQPAPLPVP